MGVKVATTCLQSVLPHSPSSSQTLASAISSPSSKRHRNGGVSASSLLCRFVHPTPLHRSRSLEHPLSSFRTIRRTCSTSFEFFSSSEDEEFDKKIEDLALRFQFSNDNNNNAVDSDSEVSNNNGFVESSSMVNFEPPWSIADEIIPANILRKANSVELPFSLRIIKKKLQLKEGFREAGESASSSVKKAFSSMVFIVRELQSYTLQMREILYYEDLQGILQRVQREMHASFVWLFQQVFSTTPTLMVYVMILLANFTVYSMGHNTAIAAAGPPEVATTEVASTTNFHDQKINKIDSSAIKTFSVSSNGKKTAYVGGGNGGGGKFRPAANGTDGEGRFDRSDLYRGTVVPDVGASQSQVYKTGETEEEEEKLWNSMVEEASRMEVGLHGEEGLDRETMKRFVSPVMASIESDKDYAEFLRTELVYQIGLSQEPKNPLLLANYAQFLYLVAHDYHRAEEYFKRAIEVEPPDAEAYNKYATFLWKVKNDLWAAEETYLEAISADPTNSYYAANYAHFLWNTGGEDTCFPLDSPDTSREV